MKKKWIGIVVVACVILAPVIIRISNADPGKVVDVEKAMPRQIKASILASGNLVYEKQVQLSPEVIGKVTEILVKEGDHVKAGQILLRLDESGYRAEVTQQEALVNQQRLNIEHQLVNVENQDQQLARKRDLLDRKYITRPQFEDVKYADEMAKIDLNISRESLRQAQAVLTQSNEHLAKTTIRAPIEGTVMAIDIKVGETAVSSTIGISGSNLMTIANTGTIMAEVNIDEADMARISVGQEVVIRTATYPDKPLEGIVKAIPLSPKKNEGGMLGQASLSRNYSVRVSVINPDNLLLRPGMTCRAEIFTETAGQALAVPVQAIFTNNDESSDADTISSTKRKSGTIANAESYLFVDRNGVAEKRMIKTGISDDAYQEILVGVKIGETVVKGPYKMLRHLVDGDRIKQSKPPAGADLRTAALAESAVK